jgi:SAM-dependent methyltransferase
MPDSPEAAAVTHDPRLFAGGRRTAFAVATVSFATLLLELALTRLFSVVLFYHFAFLAISIALLGLGAGGVLAYVRRESLARLSLGQIGARVCLLQAAAVLVGLWFIVRAPVTPQLTTANMLWLTLVYAAATPPFVGTGLLFSVVFARQPGRIAQLYGADLAGGAVACLAVVPLLNRLGAPNAVLMAALALGVAALLWSERPGERRISVAVGLALLVLLAMNHGGRIIDIVYAKGVVRDPAWVEYARWNAISRVEVVRMQDDRMVLIDADASTFIVNADLPSWQEWRPWGTPLMATPPAVANVLRPSGAFAIIGPGGGVDVLRAVGTGSPSVTGIEINPIIVDDIMRGRYAGFSRHLYELPQVHIHVGDGRSFIRNARERYDVLQMTLVDTWATTAAGAFALSENGLYTIEAFREYFDHLRPDGFLAITRWEFSEPREALRVVSQAMETLLRMGVGAGELPGHFIVVSDGPLDTDGRAVTVLAKRTPFTPQEEEIVRAHLVANPNLAALYLPSAPADVNVFASLLHSGNPTAFSDHYPFDISPVTDDSPFFFFTFKTANLWRSLTNPSEHGLDWKVNLGVVVLGMVLVISLVAVAAFLVLPLALHTHTRRADFLPMVYFVAVGLGYILVEIAFIQRFVLFLGHPTYALTVVVFLMLLASGAGSFLSPRWPGGAGPRLVTLLLIIGAGVLLHVWLLPGLLAGNVGRAFPVKLAMSALLLGPLALVMGMPFPTGLRALSERNAADGESRGTIEWAWAMNAAASVLGSVLAMTIAIHAGLSATLAAGALAYAVAAVAVASLRRT